MKVNYNPYLKKFVIEHVKIDLDNLNKSYLAMLKEADKQCALISNSKVF